MLRLPLAFRALLSAWYKIREVKIWYPDNLQTIDMLKVVLKRGVPLTKEPATLLVRDLYSLASCLIIVWFGLSLSKTMILNLYFYVNWTTAPMVVSLWNRISWAAEICLSNSEPELCRCLKMRTKEKFGREAAYSWKESYWATRIEWTDICTL